MRRKAIPLVLVLPAAANALSLSNFQIITSAAIPLSCQLTYNDPIPSCTAADFNNGCSQACINGLLSTASDVSDACSDVEVSPNTLLGIVMNNGIIRALCPGGGKTTTTSKSTATQVTSVTIPTNSQGVTGGLGLKTTTTSQSSSSKTTATSTTQTTPSTTSIQSTTSTSETTTSTSSETTPSATQTPTPDPTLTTTANSETTSTSTSTKPPTSSSTPEPDRGSGGGSPFDISSNSSGVSILETRSVCLGTLVMFWISVVLVR